MTASNKPSEDAYPEGTPTSLGLRGGFEFEDAVALCFVIRVFTEVSESHDLIVLEDRAFYPFDDIVWKRSDGLVYAFQVKWNKPGSLSELKNDLANKSKQIAKIEKLKAKGYKCVCSACIGEEVLSDSVEPILDQPTYLISEELIDAASLPSAYASCFIQCFSDIHTLRRWLKAWFVDKHGDHGLNQYSQALDEVDDIRRHKIPEQRIIDQKRALELLGLARSNIDHSVYELSDLIDRPAFLGKLKQSLDDNRKVLLLGEPGSGKTAFVEQLYSNLEKDGNVTRYSFFTNRDDPFYQDRLTTEFMLREISEVGQPFQSKYVRAASFEKVISTLKASDSEYTFLIDGLDHVSRGRSDELDSFGDYFNKLSGLKNVKLLLSLQNVSQLPLSFEKTPFKVMVVPPLSEPEIRDITEKHSITEYNPELIRALKEKSASNPLLLHYLLKKLLEEPFDLPNAIEKLESIPKLKGVIEYLYSITNGLSNEQLILLRYACALKFGFEKPFFNEIAKALGLRPIEVDKLWNCISHVLKRTGQARYNAWHYSLEKVLVDKDISMPVDLLSLLTKIPQCGDLCIYKPLASIGSSRQNLSTVCNEVKSDALAAKIDPAIAEQLIDFACDKAVAGHEFIELIKCLFAKIPIRNILSDLNNPDIACEIIALSEGEKTVPMQIYDYADELLLNKALEVEGLLVFIRDNNDLSWLVTRGTGRRVMAVAAYYAYETIRRNISAKQILNKIETTAWYTDDELDSKYQQREGHREVSNENHNLGLAHYFGKALALNRSFTDFTEWVNDPKDVDSEFLTRILYSGCQCYMGRAKFQYVSSLERILRTPDIEPHHLYILAESKRKRKVLRDALNIFKDRLYSIVEYSLKVPYYNDEGVNLDAEALFSLVMTACKLNEQGFLALVKEQLLLEEEEENYEALADCINALIKSQKMKSSILDELKLLALNRISAYTYSKMSYRNNISYYIKTLIRMGLIRYREVEECKRFESFRQLGISIDRMNVLSHDIKRSNFDSILRATDNELRRTREATPHEWQETSSKLGALYVLKGKKAKGLECGLNSYRLNHVYAYHKDMTYYLLLEAFKAVKDYLGVEYAKEKLLECSEYLPVIDRITDGDETDYWYSYLTDFIFENESPADSLLLGDIYQRIRNRDDHWPSRLPNLFETQLKNVEQKYFAEWVSEVWKIYFNPNEEGLEASDILSFRKWILHSVKQDSFWRKSSISDSLRARLKHWCKDFTEFGREQLNKIKIGTWSWQDYRLKEHVEQAEIYLGIRAEEKEDQDRRVGNDRNQKKKLFAEKLSSEEGTVEALCESLFWFPAWVASGDLYVDEVVMKLRSMDNNGIDAIIASISNSLTGWRSADIAAFTPRLAQVLGELGLKEELISLTEEMVKYFKELFVDLRTDMQFRDALRNVEFY